MDWLVGQIWMHKIISTKVLKMRGNDESHRSQTKGEEHMIRGTSLEAYRDHILSGEAGAQTLLVFDVVKEAGKEGITRKELSVASNVTINAVCGRANELIKAGLMYELERRPCRITGRNAHPLIVEDNLKEMNNA